MFLVVDGPDGAGKTSAAKALCARLSETRPVFYTREPSLSAPGREIRALLRGREKPDPAKLTDLFLRDRQIHIETEIKPRLEAGDWVVCDRYKYSTVVYQQIQGLDRDTLIRRNRDFWPPQAAFILTAARVEVLLERIHARGDGRELFETRAFLEKALRLYAEIPACFPQENIHIIDAGQTTEEIVENMLAAIQA